MRPALYYFAEKSVFSAAAADMWVLLHLYNACVMTKLQH
jgi:hypothetical protein